MKRKKLIKIFLPIIFMIFLIIALIMFFKSKYNINLFENMKVLSKVQNQQENDTSDITVLDVTGIMPGEETQHEHIYKTMYDEGKHWEECMSCGKIQNETVHSFTTKWALGFESCNQNNYYTNTCECGYSYIGHKTCFWNGSAYSQGGYYGGFFHSRTCSVSNHKGAICDSYYLNNKLYSAEYNTFATNFPHFQYCHTSDGKILTCKNLGTCCECKRVYSAPQHYIYADSSDCELKCRVCNESFGTYLGTINRNSDTPGTYTINNTYRFTDNVTFLKAHEICHVGNPFSSYSHKLTSSNRNEFTTTSIVTLSTKTIYGTYAVELISIDGITCYLYSCTYNVSPDIVSPNILDIKQDNSDDLSDWSRTKPIFITGTENYCDTVNVEIVDDLGNSIFKGDTVVTNGNYSIACTPEIETGLSGRNFKAIVIDACDNKTEQEFEVARVDAIAPEIISADEIGGDWSREKNFTFTATDHGIGNVQIGFNDVNDYSLAIQDGENFSREYKLVGDVYAPREANIYYKDGLGNISTKKIIIDKLDNTAPTITNINIHNNKLSVTTHDKHEVWGDGSGVVKYRYMVSGEKIENPDVSTFTNELNVGKDIVIENLPEVKYVYVVAEDLVGNVSKVYEVEIPQLVLTSEVRLELANGKGGVKLDWSTYDISDKYFVIYRKKENETEWQEIVSLQDKLTENTYIDEFANDNENSNAPTIQIQENIENNNINISPTSTDNGSKYTYYIESYDSSTNLLLNKSN